MESLNDLFKPPNKHNTSLVNIKNESCDIFIGRPSKWGNPFSHKNGTLAKFKVDTRKEAVSKYKEYIETGDGKHLLKDLKELKGKKLGCYCFPKLCHGNVLIKLINKYEV